MPAPKGVRTIRFRLNDTDAVHVYSDATGVWLQLRRHVPTEENVGAPSFKLALALTTEQAIAVAGELLTAATCHHPADRPKVPELPEAPAEAVPAPSAAVEDTPPAATETPATIDHPPEATHRSRPWSEAEEEYLLRAFDDGLTIPQLARIHQRSAWGVQARLVKHGRLTLEQCQIFESEPT